MLLGLPVETISGGIGAAMGAYITMKAQSHAMLMETLQQSIAISKSDNRTLMMQLKGAPLGYVLQLVLLSYLYPSVDCS